jgi:hypothetical protein
MWAAVSAVRHAPQLFGSLSSSAPNVDTASLPLGPEQEALLPPSASVTRKALLYFLTGLLVDAAVLVPTEFVRDNLAIVCYFEVDLQMDPTPWGDLQNILPIELVVIGPLPVAKGLRCAVGEAAQLVELKLPSTLIPKHPGRPIDALLPLRTPLYPVFAPVLHDLVRRESDVL